MVPISTYQTGSNIRYALERHLRQDEVIYPRSEIGKFRGDPVFARHTVTPLKSAENWLRTSGRTIRPGAQPLKLGKVRAATLNKRRAVEMAASEAAASGQEPSESSLTQGLYARFQTEPFVADPVVDVRIAHLRERPAVLIYDFTSRVRYQRTNSETSIYIRLRCCRSVLCMCHVSQNVSWSLLFFTDAPV